MITTLKRIVLLFFILGSLSLEVGYLSYKCGKWVAHYEDSMKHLGDCKGE